MSEGSEGSSNKENHQKNNDGPPDPVPVVIDDEEADEEEGKPENSQKRNESNAARTSPLSVLIGESAHNGSEKSVESHEGSSSPAVVNVDCENDGEKMEVRSGTRNGPRPINAKDSSKAGSRKPGESTLRRLLEEASYELEEDSYRGLARYSLSVSSTSGEQQNQADPMEVDNTDEKDGEDEERKQPAVGEKGLEDMEIDEPESNTDIVSTPESTSLTCIPAENRQAPKSLWEISCCPFRDDDTGNASETSEKARAPTDRPIHENMVQWACHNQCPTMLTWTEKAVEQSRRKQGGRKRKGKNKAATTAASAPALGQRPEGLDIRCRCDANPFCLATLGGAMNDVLMRDLKLQLQLQKQQSSGSSRSALKEKNGESKAAPNGETAEAADVVEEDDADVIVVEDPTNFNRPKTREQLKQVRRSVCVDESRIRSYLRKSLQDLGSQQVIGRCMSHIREHHQDLIFVNPVDEENNVNNNRSNRVKPAQMPLSLPPGIENLGATCYLNTQLQCLAQNTVFLQGIFSWAPPQSKDKQDRMTSVLKLFQRLLVSMHAGSKATTDTLEFSNALGLDHFEQQDPNEFSRLFFERMHESFQQGKSEDSNGKKQAPSEKGNDSDRDLAQLLPTLFQGVIRYETTCHECKTVSTRKEEFMDVMLPIAKPDDDEKKKKQKRQKGILDWVNGAEDVDVQFCWDQYCVDETFNGENQYHCSVCEAKRDATRKLCFQKLPPVLNVQLSRYIFDVASLSKKKLTDRVLLPLSLQVEQKETQSKSSEEKEYVLCAVMRHQGKSAYSGHYIAEAMDWTTGEWFEFNDEKVSLLSSGPSNSFDPYNESNGKSDMDDSTTSTAGKQKKMPKGSEDAYNLYYVEEEFLASSLFEFLAQRKPWDDPGVLKEAAYTRFDEYADLAQLCREDQTIHGHLSRRRELILQRMFPPDYFLHHKAPSATGDYVWVDAEFLRKFMSCEKSFVEEVTDGHLSLLLDQRRFVCEHQSPGPSSSCTIPPSVARKGKVLPLTMFQCLMEIIKEEIGSDLMWDNDLCVPLNGLACKECEKSYRLNLRGRVERLTSAVQLYEKLDPKEEKCSPTNSSEDGDDDLFVVSRKFITAFRNEVARVMKVSSNADTTAVPDRKILGVGREFAGEGVDALKLQFSFDLGSDEDVDISVNTSITCQHGNCLNTVTKRNARHVLSNVWKELKAFFPSATEHRVPASIRLENRMHPGCPTCNNDELVVDTSYSKLSGLAKLFFNQTKNSRLECQEILEEGSGPYRLVYNEDLVAMLNFCVYFKKHTSKVTVESMKMKLEELFLTKSWCESSLHPTCPFEGESLTTNLGRFFRPLICEAHQKPFRSTLVEPFHPKRAVQPLNSGLAVLDENAYADWATQLAAIAYLYTKLDLPSPRFEDFDMDVDQILDEAKQLCRASQIERCHPTIHWVHRSSDFALSMESNEVSILLCPKDGVCDDPECSVGIEGWLTENMPAEKTNRKKDPPGSKETISIDSDDDDGKDAKKKMQHLTLPVVEVEEGASDERVLTSLAQCSGAPIDSDNPTVRRSGRRRKTRFPLGVVTSEETVRCDFSNNLASLRLLLLERCQMGAPFGLSNHIKLAVWPKRNVTDVSSPVNAEEEDTSAAAIPISPVLVDLQFPLNEKSLLQICQEKVSSEIDTSELENQVFLIRSARPDPSAKDIPEDNLMDHLLNLSNVCTEAKNGKRKKRTPEKGFTGTFLTSSKGTTSAPPNTSSTNSSPTMKSALKDETTTNGGSSPKRTRFADAMDVEDSPENGKKPGAMESPYEILDSQDSLGSCVIVSSSFEDTIATTTELAVTIASQLLANPMVDKENENVCLEVGQWVARKNPGVTSHTSLADEALAKYLEMTAM